MRSLGQLGVVMVVISTIQVGCDKGGKRACPEGMRAASDKNADPHTFLCATGDRKRARWTEYYPDGSQRQSCGFSDGRPEGTFTAWHRNGQLWIEGQYRQGVKVGRWNQLDEVGRKVAEAEYREGAFVAGAPVGLPAACERVKL